jgi:negative regulator of flagellin synthesis FlgM
MKKGAFLFKNFRIELEMRRLILLGPPSSLKFSRPPPITILVFENRQRRLDLRESRRNMSIQAPNDTLLSAKNPARSAAAASLSSFDGKTSGDARRTPGGARDRVTFSIQATKIRDLTRGAQSTDAVRLERVEELRARIADGTFRPAAEEIADAILRAES